ncbi:hypothetical protein [Roseiconus lacunae]|uniref:Uncharacterized protein n=1 Tax=Roseiconus lacunae TaxID=2605694 RepID=A0ABT7PPA2_9BACT|nr:hypothetical protein [Roseiconus lacunae]MDM4018340.1 hypothetical protein [Roseiconus lacunae]
MRSSTKQSIASRRPEPNGSDQAQVRVHPTVAANWLRQLNQLFQETDCMPDEFSRFHKDLEDACWLANWKRDDVQLAISPTRIVSIAEEIAGIANQASLAQVKALEEILSYLLNRKK